MEQERNEQLEHHGIKNMKWGIRRYQYADGSLTPAGKKRYAKDVERLKAKNEKLAVKIKGKKAQAAAMSRVAKLKAEAEAKKAELRGLKKSDKKDADKAAPEAPALSKKEAKKAAKAAEAESKKAKRSEEIQKSVDKDNAEMAKKKLEIARSGDVKKIAANAHLFSDKEIDDLKKRVENEAAIQAKIPESARSKIFKALYKDVAVPVATETGKTWFKKMMDRTDNLAKADKEAKEAAAKAKKIAKDAKAKADKDAAKEARSKMIQNLTKSKALDLIKDHKLSYDEITQLKNRFNLEDEVTKLWNG